MISARRVSYTFLACCVLTGLLLVTSCTQDDPTQPTVTGILLKPGGGVVKVEITDPPGAPQETILDVYVMGSGFDEGSEATFLLDGLPNPKVSTNSNHFVSHDTLIANITIAAEADTALYDVQVMTTRGKKGIGVDLFHVVKKGMTVGDTPITVEFRESVLDPETSDGVLSDGGGLYMGIFRENGSMIFSTLDGSRNEARLLCFDYAGQTDISGGCIDALLTTSDPGFDGNEVGGMLALEPGELLHTSGQFMWGSVEVINGKDQPAEWYLRFGSNCELADQSLPQNRFEVLRVSQIEWTFEGNNAVLCRRWLKGRPVSEEIGRFSMPFSLDIVIQP